MLRRAALAIVLAGMSLVFTAPAQARVTAAPVSATGAVPVFVHASTIATARTAVANSGLTLVTTWDKIGVAVARGTASQVDAVRRAGPDPTARRAGPTGGRTGGSAAIIDTGVDGTHPFFREADGSSAARLNLKNVCGPLTDLKLPLPLPNDTCFANLTAVNDTDTLSAGGHGTHVRASSNRTRSADSSRTSPSATGVTATSTRSARPCAPSVNRHR